MTMATRIRNTSPFVSAASKVFKTFIPSGDSFSNLFGGSTPSLREVVGPRWNVIIRFILSMPFEDPSPPPTRCIDYHGPHLWSRTVGHDPPLPSRVRHSYANLNSSATARSNMWSFLLFGMLISFIGFLGLGIACLRLFGGPISSSTIGYTSFLPDNTSFKPSSLSKRCRSILRTTIRLVTTTCCVYGAIQIISDLTNWLPPSTLLGHTTSYLTWRIQLALASKLDFRLTDLRQYVTSVHDVRWLFDLVRSFVPPVLPQLLQDRGGANLTSWVSVFKDAAAILALVLSETSYIVWLLKTFVSYVMSTFPITKASTLRINAVLEKCVHKSLQITQMNIIRHLWVQVLAMAPYSYGVLRPVSRLISPSTLLTHAVPLYIRTVNILLDAAAKVAIPFATCNQLFSLPPAGASFAGIRNEHIVELTLTAFKALFETIFWKLPRRLCILTTSITPTVVDLKSLALACNSLVRVATTFIMLAPQMVSLDDLLEDLPVAFVEDDWVRTSVDVTPSSPSAPSSPVPNAATSASPLSSEWADTSCSVEEVLENPEKTAEKKSRNTPVLRIDTLPVFNSVHNDSAASSPSSAGPSLLDSASRLGSAVTPATSIQEFTFMIPPPKTDNLDLPRASITPQREEDFTPSTVPASAPASSSATGPLVAPTNDDEGGEWTVVDRRRPKRRTPKAPQATFSTRRSPPVPPPTVAQSVEEEISMLEHEFSRLSLRSLRSRSPSVASAWSQPRQAEKSSSSKSWVSSSSSSAASSSASNSFCFSEEEFPALPSRMTSLHAPISQVPEQDLDHCSSSSEDPIEEYVAYYDDGVDEVPSPFLYDEWGNFLQTMEPYKEQDEDEDDEDEDEGPEIVVRLPPSSAYGGKVFLPIERGELHNPLVIPPETRTQFMFEDLFEATEEIVARLPRATFPPRC